MPIYALDDQIPSIHPDAFVHPDAVVIGSVTIGAQSSIWPGAVLRGDDGYITIGERTSIQDGTIVHTTPHLPTVVGDDCLVGHAAHLEGCRLDNWSQVSSGAVVLHGVVLGHGAIVAANSVVLNGTEVPPGALAAGAPAVVKEGRARLADIEHGVAAYVAKAQRFRRGLRRVD